MMYDNPMLAKFTLCKPCKFAYSSVCEKAENRVFEWENQTVLLSSRVRVISFDSKHLQR